MKLQQIEKIFCINLDHRKDRREACESIFKRLKLDVEFFSAIDGKKINVQNKKISDGHVGCCLSHREIYKIIEKSSWNNVLILEDDVEFHENIESLFEEYYKQVPEDWNLLYFGGNHNRQKYKMINQNIHRLSKTYTTHCYMVKKNAIPVILRQLSEERIYNHEVDVHLSFVQNIIPCYGFIPHLAWQRSSYSDILDANTNYEFLKDNSLLENKGN